MVVASVAVGAVYFLARVDFCVYGGGVLLLLLRMMGIEHMWCMKGVLLKAGGVEGQHVDVFQIQLRESSHTAIKTHKMMRTLSQAQDTQKPKTLFQAKDTLTGRRYVRLQQGKIETGCVKGIYRVKEIGS